MILKKNAFLLSYLFFFLSSTLADAKGHFYEALAATNQNFLTKASHEALFNTAQKILQEYLAINHIKDNSALNASIQNGLALIRDDQNKTAIAIFELPDRKDRYQLTQAEMQHAKNIFDVYSIENSGTHKVVRFRYHDKNLLPESRAQALLLLYGPYVKDSALAKTTTTTALRAYRERLKNSLNESQQEALKGHYSEATLTTKNDLSKNQHLQEGFLGSTLIKTEAGYRKIEDIKVGDKVACRNPQTSQQTYSEITFADKIHLPKHIQIAINGDVVHVAPDHKFYAQAVDKWYTAQDLKDYPDLRKAIDPRIQDVQEVDQELDVVRITVDKNHNFYITKNDILAHNFIEVVITWGTQGIIVAWEIAVPAAIATAGGIAYWLNKSKQKPPNLQPQDPNQSPSPQGPEDKNKNGKYEDAPYHHQNSRGAKSPAPQDGQKALDNSVQVEDSQRRIGISENQFVVLGKTQEGLYHGHVRSWNELTRTMQKALENAGKVTRSGKII